MPVDDTPSLIEEVRPPSQGNDVEGGQDTGSRESRQYIYIPPSTASAALSGSVPFPSIEGNTSENSGKLVSTLSRILQSTTSQDSPNSQTNTAPQRPPTSNTKSSPSESPRLPNSSGLRNVRPVNFNITNLARGFRHSLDASASLPSFSTTDFESPALSTAWGTPHNFNLYGGASVVPPLPSTSEDGSPSMETSKQRVSFESDRVSLPTTRNINRGVSRLTRGSDPPLPSSVLRSSPFIDERNKYRDPGSSRAHHARSRSPSETRSRATSPLRMLHQWYRGSRTAEEPFVPVNPFTFKNKVRPTCFCIPGAEDVTHSESSDISQHHCGLSGSTPKSFLGNTRIFFTDTLPRQLYLNILLHIPAMYFSRVSKIFEDAEVSRPDIQRIIDEGGGRNGNFNLPLTNPGATSTPVHAAQRTGGQLPPNTASGVGVALHVGTSPAASAAHINSLPCPDEWAPGLVSPALIRFKHSWEAFIDSLMREWKTLNLVSALLASAILTIFQVPQAANDPLTRTSALLSLICGLMSLSYGCVYVVRFGTMRSMYRASRWAEEAKKDDTVIWWNVWVLLAMPAVWLAWSMLFFLFSILSFVWRSGSVSDPDERAPLSTLAILGPRIAISFVLFLGMVYFAFIVRSLKRYGTHGATRGILGVARGYRGERGRIEMKKPKDIDGAMETRGRRKERSSSTKARRREEATRSTERENVKGVEEAGSAEGEKEKGGLPSLLGLGLTLFTSRDSGVEVDLEKGDRQV